MGPGKVRDDFDNGTTPLRRLGLLYDFDVGSDVVKPVHKKWLDDNVVPAAKGSRGAQVFLKGMASRSGSAAFNEALSERRVNAVKNYLLSKGATGDQVLTTFVGELDAALRGEADGTEDEEERAVAVMLKRTPKGLPEWRRQNAQDTLDGFDPSAGPPFLMVPALGGPARSLLLLNGGGLTIKCDNPLALKLVDPTTNLSVDELTIVGDRTVVTFRGQAPGEAIIFTEDLDGDEEELLQVAVLPKKTASVAFFQVEDKTHKTTRDDSDADFMIDVANDTFNRQANIFFEKSGGMRPAKFDKDLGDPTTNQSFGGFNLPLLAKKNDANARINVYYVWNFQMGNEGPNRDTDARVESIPGHIVVFEDDAGTDEGLTISHEFGHCFGLEHNDKSQELLMWPTTDERGGRLTHAEILKANAGV